MICWGGGGLQFIFLEPLPFRILWISYFQNDILLCCRFVIFSYVFWNTSWRIIDCIIIIVIIIIIIVVFPLLFLAYYYFCPSTVIKSKLLWDLRGVLLAWPVYIQLCYSWGVSIINENVVTKNISAVDTTSTQRRSVINNPGCSVPYWRFPHTNTLLFSSLLSFIITIKSLCWQGQGSKLLFLSHNESFLTSRQKGTERKR